MNKTILFTLIEKEINELEILVKGMKEIETLSPTLLSLAKSKTAAILEDFDQISHLDIAEMEQTPLNSLKKDSELSKDDKKIEHDEPQKRTSELSKGDRETEYDVPLNPLIETSELSQEEQFETPPVEPSILQKPEKRKESMTHVAVSLAEMLNTTKQSLNEVIALQAEASLSETMQNSKVDDLKQAFSLADRFRFQRELFGGNGEKLNTTLSHLNASKSPEEAMALLKPFDWDENDPRVLDFIRIVLRKFSAN